jgi:hypothetical protein
MFVEIRANSVNTSETRIAKKGSALNTLAFRHLHVTRYTNKLLLFLGEMQLAIARCMEHVETFLAEMVQTLFAF